MSTNLPGDAYLDALIAAHDDVRAQYAGEWVRYRDSPALRRLAWATQTTCERINAIYYTDPDEAQRLFREMVPGAGDGVEFTPPFRIDYGNGLFIGDRTFINRDFLVTGGGRITIGSDSLIGPRCSIYTPNHAEPREARREGWERVRPVTIGDNVWLGGSVTILPGVTIGSDSIIGAGSVVTRDIPTGTVAVGNPCVPVRPIADDDTWGREAS